MKHLANDTEVDSLVFQVVHAPGGVESAENTMCLLCQHQSQLVSEYVAVWVGRVDQDHN